MAWKRSSHHLPFWEENPLVTHEFPHKRSVMRRFDMFFDYHLNRLFKKGGTVGDLRRHGAHVTLLYWIPKLILFSFNATLHHYELTYHAALLSI